MINTLCYCNFSARDFSIRRETCGIPPRPLFVDVLPIMIGLSENKLFNDLYLSEEVYFEILY